MSHKLKVVYVLACGCQKRLRGSHSFGHEITYANIGATIYQRTVRCLPPRVFLTYNWWNIYGLEIDFGIEFLHTYNHYIISRRLVCNMHHIGWEINRYRKLIIECLTLFYGLINKVFYFQDGVYFVIVCSELHHKGQEGPHEPMCL